MARRKTPLERLDDLAAATVAAHVRVQEAVDAERRAVTDANGAIKALEGYFIAVGRGDREEDVNEQARLAAAAADARANLDTDKSGRSVHLRARAQLEGARQKLAQAERAEAEFARVHAADLATAMAAEAQAAVEKIEAARAQLRSAYRGRQSVATRFNRLAATWGLSTTARASGQVPDDGAGRDLLQLAERAIGPHTLPIPGVLRAEFEEHGGERWPTLERVV